MPVDPQTVLTAAMAWGSPLAPPRLISARENLVYRVDYPSFSAALRLHRPGYQSGAAIRSELLLTEALAASGCPVPAPVRTASQDLLAAAGPRLASLVLWCDGRPFGSGEQALAHAPQQMHRLGQQIAQLHHQLDVLTLPPDFTRPHWDAAGFLGASPNWGRFWDSPSATDQERDALRRFRRAAKAALAEDRDQGLIHADLLRENILLTPTGLTFIDFDDCGFGPRLFDLATALVQSLTDADLSQQITALLSGYGEIRRLPDRARRDLTLFIGLRLGASIGWLGARRPPGDPGHRLRLDRALPVQRLWLEGGWL